LHTLTRPFELTDLLQRIKFILESGGLAAQTG